MKKFTLTLGFLFITSSTQAAGELEWRSSITFSCDTSAEIVQNLPTGSCDQEGNKKCQLNADPRAGYPSQAECQPKRAEETTELVWSPHENSTSTAECNELVSDLPQRGTPCSTKFKKICKEDHDKRKGYRICAPLTTNKAHCFFEDRFSDTIFIPEADRSFYSKKETLQWFSVNAEGEATLECVNQHGALQGNLSTWNEKVQPTGSLTFPEPIDGPGDIYCDLRVYPGGGTCATKIRFREKISCQFDPVANIKKGEGALLKWSAKGTDETSLSCEQNGKFVYQNPLGAENTRKANDTFYKDSFNFNGRVTCSLNAKKRFESDPNQNPWEKNICEVSFDVGVVDSPPQITR